MRCPFCGHLESMVKDSRGSEDGSVIRRRRQCPVCGARFTTFERVELRELFVIKKSGRRVPFDRDKLMRSIKVALRKRPVEEEQIGQMLNGIVRQLESMGETDISSEMIGTRVMAGLAGLDKVAYIRYASVYQSFHDMKDFQEFMKSLDEFSQPLKDSSSVDEDKDKI